MTPRDNYMASPNNYLPSPDNYMDSLEKNISNYLNLSCHLLGYLDIIPVKRHNYVNTCVDPCVDPCVKSNKIALSDRFCQ